MKNNLENISGAFCSLLNTKAENKKVMVLISNRQTYQVVGITIEGEHKNYMKLQELNNEQFNSTDVMRLFKRITGLDKDYIVDYIHPVTSDPDFKEVISTYHKDMYEKRIPLLNIDYITKGLSQACIDYSDCEFWKPDTSHQSNITSYHNELTPAQEYYTIFKDRTFNLDWCDENATINKDMEQILDKLRRGVETNALFYGPTDTGKTYGICAYAKKHNIPVLLIQFHPGMEKDDLISYKTYEDGKVVLKRCALTDFFELGNCFIIFDELNYLRAVYAGILNGVLDKTIQLDGGEIITRGPNCHIIATMNPGYDGTTDLNNANLRRLGRKLQVLETFETFKSKFNLDSELNYHNDLVIQTLWDSLVNFKAYAENQGDMVDLSYTPFKAFLKDLLDEDFLGNLSKDSFLSIATKSFTQFIVNTCTVQSSISTYETYEALVNEHMNILKEAWFASSSDELGDYQPEIDILHSMTADDVDIDNLMM